MKKNLYIIWNESNNTEIPIIDEQHRAIVSLINTLHYFIIKKKKIEIIEPILATLDQYTKFHFYTEEEILESINYPEIKEHLEHHKLLITDTIKLSLKAKNDNDPEMLLEFLKNWWLNHICIEDRKYAEYKKGQE